MASSLKGVSQKIARAHEHFDTITSIVSAYNAGADIALEIDSSSGLLMLKAKVPPLSDDLAPIIGDCVHNVRSALDHLIWQLVLKNRKIPTPSLMFPVCETRQAFQGQLQRGRLQGVYPNAITAIETLQPYASGDDTLSVLSKLDNIDKHRTLLVSSCLITRQEYTLRHPQTKAILCYGAAVGTKMRDGELILGINTKATSIPDNPIVEGDRDSYVAFGEGQPVGDREVLQTLGNAIAYVERTVISSLNQWLV